MSKATTFDALIIGGGPAGLGVALGLARQLRSTMVFDSHSYRNGKVHHMHTVPTWDHQDPEAYRAAARKELAEGRYKTIKFSDTKITKVKKTYDGVFEATDGTGAVFTGRKLVLASGVKDIPPPIKGYVENWPKSIFHCLFCHGFEEAGAASAGILADGMLANPQGGEAMARMAHNLAKTVTIYTNGDVEVAKAFEKEFQNDPWATIESRRVAEIHSADDNVSVQIELDNGSRKTERFLVHVMKSVPKLDFENNLELEVAPSGAEFKTTSMFNETTCKGCFVAGDVATPIKAVPTAVGLGTLAAAGAVMSLVMDDKGK